MIFLFITQRFGYRRSHFQAINNLRKIQIN
jgi:hypothetical protein